MHQMSGEEKTLTIVLKPNRPHAQVFVNGEQVGTFDQYLDLAAD